MMSLFSVFDPVSGWMLPNWVSMIVVLTLFPVCMYVVQSKEGKIYSKVSESLGEVFKEISSPNFLGLVMISVGLFVFISMNNGVGLFPFIFTGTSHEVITLSMGLVMWLSFFVMGWVKKFKDSSAHLTPEGCPLVLAPFLVLIELVSQIIRPVTLSVRLAANMMAGHLIIGLIASVSDKAVSLMVMSVFLQSLMMILEVAVAFIQAFVFSVLVMLYALESY